MVLGDIVTGFVYLVFFIVGLVKFRQAHLVFTFSMFIGLCGLSHFASALTNYIPAYQLEVTVKGLMAAVSVYALGLVIFKKGTFIGVYKGAARE